MEKNPTPLVIKEKRLAHNLSQSEASQLVHRSLRNWQQWEQGDRKMDLALWELFNIKVNRLQKGYKHD